MRIAANTRAESAQRNKTNGGTQISLLIFILGVSHNKTQSLAFVNCETGIP
jgi:hypothetical protein